MFIPRRFCLSAPNAVFAAVITAIAMLAGVSLWRVMEARASELRQHEQSAGNLAQALAQHTTDVLQAADTALVGIRDRIEASGSDVAFVDTLRRELLDHAANLPDVHGIFVYGADGTWLVNTATPYATPLNNSDRAYFQYHRTHRDRSVHLGKPVLSKSDGTPVMTVSRRVDTPDGRFAGVVLATISLEDLSRYFASFALGEHGAIALTDTDGDMVARHPFDHTKIGTRASGADAIQSVSSGAASGSWLYASPVDGVRRLGSFRRLDRFPLILVVSYGVADALEAWRGDTRIDLGVCAVAAAALAGIAFWLSAALKRQQSLQARLTDELTKQALTDGLTQLANRRSFDMTSAREWRRACRDHVPLSVLLIDIDHFKQFNDRYGHPAGDKCLSAVAAAVEGCCRRPGDVAARYGGEEFAIILPNTDPQAAWAIAERMRLAVAALQIEHGGSVTAGVVTISVGAATAWPMSSQPAASQELLTAADAALYRAKSAGRNRVVFGGALESDPPAGLGDAPTPPLALVS